MVFYCLLDETESDKTKKYEEKTMVVAAAALNPIDLFSRFPAGIAQGIIWGIMALGLYITFRLLDIADLSVDGTFSTGGAVTVMLILGGWNPWLAIVYCRFGHRSAPYAAGYSRHPFRYPDAVRAVFGQPDDHGHESQSGGQR